MKSSTTKEPMTWDEKCQVVQSFIDCQDVQGVRHRREIGWFGRVREALFGSRFAGDQLLDFQAFMNRLGMFTIDNIEDTKVESSNKIGF